ncbi:MAG: CPBP family intramembrane metalloprotease [Clostridiales bacterium]|nr:CPBP family intramembrane metalloprotease [Clostridiales bacterium]
MNRDGRAAYYVFLLMTMQLILSRLSIFSATNSPAVGVGYVLYLLSYFIPVFFYILRFPRQSIPKKHCINRSLPSGPDSVLYTAAALAVTMLAVRLNALFVIVLSKLGVNIRMPELSPAFGVSGVIFTVVFMVFIPAIFEELLCRFAVMELLLPFGKMAAAVVSGILFGLMHTNLSQIIYASAAGFIIGYFVAHTRSLYLGILIHGIINAYSVALTYAEALLPARIFSYGYVFLEIAVFLFGFYAVRKIFINMKGERGTVRENSATAREGAGNLSVLLSPWILIYIGAALAAAIYPLF